MADNELTPEYFPDYLKFLERHEEWLEAEALEAERQRQIAEEAERQIASREVFKP